jgi:SAM-dependent methyltransferase
MQEKYNLNSKNDSTKFYENLYQNGYMEEWPLEKKKRILSLLKNVRGVPEHCIALDYGCGNGILTNLIKENFPDWMVIGVDISQEAISNARRNYAKCSFFKVDDPMLDNIKFDFIFSHHVLEHVYDFNEIYQILCGMANENASMLHILPCGNPGSFEYKLASLVKKGIDIKCGGRFFFEDAGHVRRLTTDQLASYSKKYDFKLVDGFYSNQFYGAINWITHSHPSLVLSMTNYKEALNQEAGRKLFIYRVVLFSLTIVRLPSQVIKKITFKKNKTFKNYFQIILALPFYLLSMPVSLLFSSLAKNEFKKYMKNESASEMALYFRRTRNG